MIRDGVEDRILGLGLGYETRVGVCWSYVRIISGYLGTGLFICFICWSGLENGGTRIHGRWRWQSWQRPSISLGAASGTGLGTGM